MYNDAKCSLYYSVVPSCLLLGTAAQVSEVVHRPLLRTCNQMLVVRERLGILGTHKNHYNSERDCCYGNNLVMEFCNFCCHG